MAFAINNKHMLICDAYRNTCTDKISLNFVNYLAPNMKFIYDYCIPNMFDT